MSEERYWAGDTTGRDPGTELDELRRACARVLGADPETWPSHGNAPLAISAGFALAHRERGDARQRIAELEAEYAEAREVRYLLQSAITAIAPTAERLSKMIADLMPALGYLSAELTEVRLMSPQVGVLINILGDYPEDAIVVVDNSKGGLRIVDRNRTISRIHLNDYGVRNGN